MEQSMEHGVERREVSKAVLLALTVAGLAFALIIIVYGVESIAPGVHDAFHDFRHTIGMPCH